MRFSLLAALFLLLLTPLAALAQDADWQPPEPRSGTFDWIRMNSGEWLGGEILGLRDDDFSFDSDELDELALDFDDVAELRSERALTLTFTDKRVATGTVAMKDGTIRVRTASGVEEYPRTDLLSIIEGRPSEWNYWSLKGSVGFVGRTGNTDQADYTATLNLRRDAIKSRIDIVYTGNLGEVESIETSNNHRLNGSFSLFLYRNLFITPLFAEFYTDRFQNIDLQATVAAGIGYYLVRNSTLEFQVSLGAGYTRVESRSVPAGEDPVEETGSILPGFAIEWDITGDIDWDTYYRGTIGIPDPAQSLHHLNSVLAVEILGPLDFNVGVTWDRVESPRPDEDGVVPERDDLRTSIGLGVDF